MSCRMSNLWPLSIVFSSGLCGHVGQLWVLFCKFLNIFRTPFIRKFVFNGFYRFNSENSIVIIQDSFKDCILARKIGNQMHTKLGEKTFQKQTVVTSLKNVCSIKYMFCTVFIQSSVTKIHEKYLWLMTCISAP